MQSIIFYRISFLFAILLLYGLVGNDLGGHFWFTLLTFFLIFYNAFEIARYFYNNSRRQQIFLAPTVITAVLVLGLGYGITNILFITPWFNLLPLGVMDGKQISNEMSKLVLLSIAGSFGLWIGQDSKLAKYFDSESFRHLLDKILPNTGQLRYGVLPIILILSAVAKIAQENLGLYGYCSTYESLMGAKNYSYYLTIFSNFGKLGLIISCLSLFYGFKDKRYALWLLIFWLIETAFGVISASKTNIVAPTLMIFLSKIITAKKINITSMIAMGFIVASIFFVALPFVDEYREIVIKTQKNGSGTCSSFKSARITAEKMLDIEVQSVLGNKAPKYLKDNVEPIYSAHDGSPVGKIMARFNYSFIGSYGLIFRDENIGIFPNNVLSEIILSPLYAWIPRFIWESKPTSNIGVFYNQKILGTVSNSSTGMGSVTYLYMGGGVFLVIVGFIFIGVTQQSFFSLLYVKNKIAGKTIFLMLLGNFSFIESAVTAYFIDMFRLIPLWLVITHFIFKASKN
jgi:hypothetical protein